jgi:hypothetical protein
VRYENPTPNPLPLRVHQSPTVGNPPTALVHRKRGGGYDTAYMITNYVSEAHPKEALRITNYELRITRLATTVANSAGSMGLGKCN